jgi:hypothetical protein
MATAMRSVVRSSVKRVVGRVVVSPSFSACGSRRALTVFNDKEKAEETIYIKREEERLLKNLMAKMKLKETKGREE